jgi:hypothetical protein
VIDVSMNVCVVPEADIPFPRILVLYYVVFCTLNLQKQKSLCFNTDLSLA